LITKCNLFYFPFDVFAEFVRRKLAFIGMASDDDYIALACRTVDL
jgi:hypothetical protein